MQMENRDYNPKCFNQHKSTTQKSNTIKAYSSNPISLRMAAGIANEPYNSICWRTWELCIKQEIFFVGYSVCPLTKRMVKFYACNNFLTMKTDPNE